MLAIVTRPSTKLSTILVQNHLHWAMYCMQATIIVKALTQWSTVVTNLE